MRRILVVEDNEQFRKAAETYFAGQRDTEVAYAGCYEAAVRHMASMLRSDGAIIDCFFPRYPIPGSDDLSLGRQALEMMRRSRGKPTPAAAALAKVRDTLCSSGRGAQIEELFAKNVGVDIAREDPCMALEIAMQKSEANQPLGIIVAQDAREMGMPFVLATSTYHHDGLTQPIYEYAGRMGWTLIDCNKDKPDQKAMPEFWEKAYRALRQSM